MFLGLGSRGGPLGGARLARALVDALVERRPLYARLVVSREEPTDALIARVDELQRRGTFHICFGGEPLAHPGIHDVIGHAARRSQVSLRTNGLRFRGVVARRG